MDMVGFSKAELEANDAEEEFYICEECQEAHEIQHIIPECVDESGKRSKSAIAVGFYRCKDHHYIYSIAGKQLI
jgi:hypothetical protein